MESVTRRTGLVLMGSAALGATACVLPALAAPPADAAFGALTRRWLESWLVLQPVTATYIGDHRFDDQIDDMSPLGRRARTGRWRGLLRELAGIDRAQLSRDNQVDAAILKTQLEYM